MVRDNSFAFHLQFQPAFPFAVPSAPVAIYVGVPARTSFAFVVVYCHRTTSEQSVITHLRIIDCAIGSGKVPSRILHAWVAKKIVAKMFAPSKNVLRRVSPGSVMSFGSLAASWAVVVGPITLRCFRDSGMYHGQLTHICELTN